MLQEDLKQLSGYVYKDNKFKISNKYIELEKIEDKYSGFYAETFFKDNTIIISFRGTDTNKGFKSATQDFLNDILMGCSTLPTQIIFAQKYYKQIKKKYPNKEIILTGHSLGGSIAQILGSETGCKTVTFSAYGTANLLRYHVKHYDNIENYGNKKDPIFVSNISNQIGKTYIIDENSEQDKVILKISGISKPDISKHKIEEMGDLSDAVEYNGQDLKIDDTLLLKASIEKCVDLKDIDTKRIFTNEEIGKMSSEEFERNEDFIHQQMNLGNVITKAEAEEKIKSGEVIWVDDYVRSDGTRVSGYYRRK